MRRQTLLLASWLILCACVQHREHIIDGKRVEAKAAMPRNSGSGSNLTKKMFVGGTVSFPFANACTALTGQQLHSSVHTTG